LTSAQRALLALSGGLAVALSLPPWGWWPLTFVGIAAFDVALGTTPSPRARGWLGFGFAFVWLAIGMAWMWQLTAPGYLVASGVYGLFHAVAAIAAPGGRWAPIGRPFAHTLAEALRFSWPFGGVPLASLGISQAAGPFAGVVRVGGVILLTWVVFQIGFALGALARRARGASIGVRPAVGGLVAVVAVVAISAVAPRGHGTGEFLDIAAVQGGGEQGTRADDVPSAVVTERHVDATRTIEADDDLDLVLWPENVVDVATFEGSDELEAITDQAARLGVPIAVGVTEDAPGRDDRFTNAEVIVTPEGDITSRYDKVRRVPFGEYVPLRGLLDALGAPVDEVPHDAVAGTAPAVLDLPDGTRLGVVISWEVFFGGRARDGVREGAGVVLNPTNGTSYSGTIVQTQQIASSRLRALETGRWVVQAAPTGFSAFVSPNGDVLDRTAVSERAVIRRTIELRSGETWYTRIGDAPVILVMVAGLAVTWWLSIDRRRMFNARRAP
jgi:apolipoprotein N-acyltransferase